jgi:hypothetical protein
METLSFMSFGTDLASGLAILFGIIGASLISFALVLGTIEENERSEVDKAGNNQK